MRTIAIYLPILVASIAIEEINNSCFFTVLAQQPQDQIDFRNVNYTLLNQLIFEKHNQKRKEAKAQPRLKDAVCQSAAQYQADYMSEYLLICHTNDFSFRGVKLQNPGDRMNHFNGTSKKARNYSGEICYCFYSGAAYVITYEELAQKTVDAFMKSPPHKEIMLSQMTYPGAQSGYFATSSNLKKGQFNYFVTGIFSYELD
jgi:uncharacterized protein YkwD